MPVFELSIDMQKLKAGEKNAVKVLENVGKEADQTKKSVDNIGKSNMKGLETSISGVAGKLAALYASFKSLQTIMGYVNNGFRVSSSIEDAQISIASILAATNDIADAQGNMYKGQEEFAQALGISSELIKEIQVLALETSATFESIVASVGGMIAPATRAGLAVEDIPAFAIKATQAMNAMQIPVQQMRTEMEALFTGNINRSQDLLATNLAITGEMVRNWREQGILVEMLNQRLESFAFSGEAIANTWSGLRSNVQDAYDYISSQTGRGMFEGAKQSYRELLALLISTEGKLGIGSDVENITNAIEELQDMIGRGLLDVTRDFIGYIKELNKPENLAELQKNLSTVWETSKTIAGIFSEVTGYVASMGKEALDAYNSMPEVMKEVGLVGVLIGGKKGLAIVAGLSVIYDEVNNILESASNFTQSLVGSELSKLNSSIEITTNAIDRLKSKQDSMFNIFGTDYTEEIQALQERLAGLIKQRDELQGKPVITDETLAKVNEYKKAFETPATITTPPATTAPIITSSSGGGEPPIDEDALKEQQKTLESLQKEFAKLTMTDQEFKEFEFTKRMDEMQAKYPQYIGTIDAIRQAQELMWEEEAEQEAKQARQENLDVQLDFYTRLAELTGDNTRLIELQTQAIQGQIQTWRESGSISEEMLSKMEELLTLEITRDPFLGLQNSMEEYFTTATDLSTQLGDAFTSAMDSFSQTTWNALKTGEDGWRSYADSVIDMLGQIATQYAITSALGTLGSATDSGSGILGFIGGLFKHDGGMANTGSTHLFPASTFQNAPRYHNGYNPVTEQPAILLKNERVLNPRETYAYNAGMNASGNSSTGENITINQEINIQAQGNIDTNGFTQEQMNGIQKQMKTSIKAVVQEEFLAQRRAGGSMR